MLSNNLRSGTAKSCGCLNKQRIRETQSLPKGEASFRAIFRRYRKSAYNRGYLFELTKSRFRLLINQKCYYCNVVPRQEERHKDRANGHYIYNGIDRLDNNGGYTIDNSVPCCGICNKMKMTLSSSEFITKIKAIFNNVEAKMKGN